MRKAAPWILEGSRVLDIGCHNGEFLEYLGARIIDSIGIDPLVADAEMDNYTLTRDSFNPPTDFGSGSFDAIALLATLEHLREIHEIAMECARILHPAGRVIITVPSPLVDKIIAMLVRIRVLDGMSLEEHHGFEPAQVSQIFTGASFSLLHQKRFQLGLNHLFVFEKVGKTTY